MNSGAASLLANAKLFELSPHHVDEGDRIGFLHEDKAAALGRLMAVDGQRDPIKVVARTENEGRPWRLVTGMHRLIGARIEGITVFAIEVSGKPEDLVDLEASENLHRRTLSPLERAKFTAALVQAARERVARVHGDLKQQQRAIQKRWDDVRARGDRPEQALSDDVRDTCTIFGRVYGWEESAVDALGMSRTAIYNDLTLNRLIVEPFPAYVERLATHRVVGGNGSQLKELAAIRPDERRLQVIELLVENQELSVSTAADQVGVRRSTSRELAPEEQHKKYTSAISTNWGRLGLPQKREFIPTLAGMLEQPSLKVALHTLLTAQIEELRAQGKLGADDAGR